MTDFFAFLTASVALTTMAGLAYGIRGIYRAYQRQPRFELICYTDPATEITPHTEEELFRPRSSSEIAEHLRGELTRCLLDNGYPEDRVDAVVDDLVALVVSEGERLKQTRKTEASETLGGDFEKRT